MKFLLTATSDSFRDDKEVLEYIDKLRKEGFDIYSGVSDNDTGW